MAAICFGYGGPTATIAATLMNSNFGLLFFIVVVSPNSH